MQAKIILKPKGQEGAMEGLQTRKVIPAFWLLKEII